MCIRDSSDTVLTECFEVGWPNAPHRVLQNSTFKRWIAAGSPALGSRPNETLSPARNTLQEDVPRYSDNPPLVGFSGEIEQMCLYAGMGVERIKEIQSAASIVEEFTKVVNEVPAVNNTAVEYNNR